MVSTDLAMAVDTEPAMRHSAIERCSIGNAHREADDTLLTQGSSAMSAAQNVWMIVCISGGSLAQLLRNFAG